MWTEYVSVNCIKANYGLITDFLEIYTFETVRRKGIPDEEYEVRGDSICA